MATGKRYYWIKLKDSFMSSDEIDYLMSQPDGANYVVLYQMLCLKTINTDGCLVSKIGEMLIPYDAEKIQRECKWFPLSTVRLALSVYKQIGLIFENPDGTLSISDYQNMIGSETDWAAKIAKFVVMLRIGSYRLDTALDTQLDTMCPLVVEKMSLQRKR